MVRSAASCPEEAPCPTRRHDCLVFPVKRIFLARFGFASCSRFSQRLASKPATLRRMLRQPAAGRRIPAARDPADRLLQAARVQQPQPGAHAARGVTVALRARLQPVLPSAAAAVQRAARPVLRPEEPRAEPVQKPRAGPAGSRWLAAFPLLAVASAEAGRAEPVALPARAGQAEAVLAASGA